MKHMVIFGLLALAATAAAVSMRGTRTGTAVAVWDQESSDTISEFLSETRAAVAALMHGQATLKEVSLPMTDRMTTQQAMERLQGKLPAEVASLVQSAGSASARGEFTEISLEKARKILNGMIYGSWLELDDKVIECKEFEERNRGTYTQVVSDENRLGAQIAALSEIIGDSNNGIETVDSMRTVTEGQMYTLTQSFEAVKLANEAEMTKRKSDLAVFDFILNFTRCQGSSFLQYANGHVHICQTSQGMTLEFGEKGAQQKLQALMTPDARQMIRDALSSTSTDSASVFLQTNSSKSVETSNETGAMDGASGRIQWQAHPTMCMDTGGGGENNLKIWNCALTRADDPSGFENQQFVMPSTGNGHIQWMGTNKCIDVQDGKNEKGTNIQLWECGPNNDAQQWIVDGEQGQIKWAKHPDKCIDVTGAGTDAGTNIHLWECGASNMAQMFKWPFNPPPQEPATPVPETVPPMAEPNPEGQWKKCNDGKPNCGLLHDTMSLEWGKFKDLVDELQATMTKNLEEYTIAWNNLNDQLTTYSTQKGQLTKELDEATSQKNADVGEQSDKNRQKRELDHEYTKTMKACNNKISEILFTNICAVKKVRNEVMTYSSITPPSKISDCDVKDWVPQDCSVRCDDQCPDPNDVMKCGGEQLITREIVVQANPYGIQCPPLSRTKKCNQFKCPVNCEMSMWSAWSKCTKDCEGGVKAKTRQIIIRPKNGGEMCDVVQESTTCNMGSCDRNCKLFDWTDWSPCSMACNGGVQDRIRTVEIPIRGEGTCPHKHNIARLEDQSCNTIDCVGDELCMAKQDLIILLDASGSLRQEGFTVLQNFASNLTDRYVPNFLGDDKIQLGYAIFGNGHLELDGTVTPALLGSSLQNNTKQVKADILMTKWQRGFTNLAQAFVLADTMFQQRGRGEAQSAVLVIWDGKYSFAFETGEKARMLKDKNTQIYMAPVAEQLAEDVTLNGRRWSSQPWQTNYEHIPGLFELSTNEEVYIQKLIVKFCPASFSATNFVKEDNVKGYTIIREKGRPHNTCSTKQYLGEVSTVDECAQLAREAGVQVFVTKKAMWFQSYTCKSAPKFEAYDMATYRGYITKACTGETIPCPNGPAEHDGWLINRQQSTWALMPAFD